MFEIDKRLHQDIKEYCKLNGLVMKDFVNKLLKKAFTIEKYGETPFAEPKMSNLEKEDIELLGDEKNEDKAVLPTDYEMPEPIKPTLPTDYETPTPVETALDIRKKEVPNNFYCTIQCDEAWEEKFEENIKNGSIITIPYVVKTNGPMIVNHSKKEKTFETTDTSSSTEEKEEIKVVRTKKRKLN